MTAWSKLEHSEDVAVWDRFSAQFNFEPSCPATGPGITEPAPSITYDISSAWDDWTYPRAMPPIVADLHTKALAAFRGLTPIGRYLYVLDWQHDGYHFDPHALSDPGNADSWEVMVVPDGDYYIFLAEDFSFGTFGHPWASTVCVFGQALIDAFEEDLPELFSKVVRRDGVPVDLGEV